MNILLVVTGMTPQIITETVYGLAIAPEDGVEPWVPDEIHVLSTKFGLNQIRGSIINKNIFAQMVRDYPGYDLDKIQFTEANMHVFTNAQGEALDDIKSKEDSEIVADAICQKVRELTADEDTELHVSIAGGRKTMGYYAGYAMSLYGRPDDRMSHVLVSDKFENVREFYYPTPYSNNVEGKDQHYVDTQEAQVWLMDLPFVRLRDGLKKTEYLNAGFSETVFKINSANSEIHLTLNTANRVIMVNKDLKLAVKLPPISFAFLQWFADLAQKQPDVLVRAPNEEMKLCANYQSYFAKHDFGNSLQFNRYLNSNEVLTKEEDLIKSLRDGSGAIILDKKQFSEIKSRLKSELTAVLGQGLTSKILPLKVNNQGFQMPLEAGAIVFNHFDNSELEQAAKNNAAKKGKLKNLCTDTAIQKNRPAMLTGRFFYGFLFIQLGTDK